MKKINYILATVFFLGIFLQGCAIGAVAYAFVFAVDWLFILEMSLPSYFWFCLFGILWAYDKEVN